jgi:HptB-dependent secretion and biofilm anti anti-sigma factor
MPIEQERLAEKKQVFIKVLDRFDFSLHQKFREAYINCRDKGQTYVVDLSQAQYMDSSALGMMLLLKDHVEKHASTIVIRQPNGPIQKVLEIAQFHRIFAIEQ